MSAQGNGSNAGDLGSGASSSWGEYLSVDVMWVGFWVFYAVVACLLWFINNVWSMFGVLVGGIFALAYILGFPVFVHLQIARRLSGSLVVVYALVFYPLHFLLSWYLVLFWLDWEAHGRLMGYFVLLAYMVYMPVSVLLKAKVEVPNNYVYVIDVWGEYYAIWKTGLHFIFPYFGMKIRNSVRINQQRMSLRMSDSRPDALGGGTVDFLDGSCPVDADVYFTIVDPERAVNNVDNVMAAVEQRLDGLLRAHLGRFTIDEVNRHKACFNLSQILSAHLEPDPANPTAPIVYPDDIEEVQAWKEMRDNWGVRLDGISISDIELSDEVIAIRERLLAARKADEVAMHEKSAMITLAEGRKQVMILEGQGQGEQLEKIMGPSFDASGVELSSMTREQAADHLAAVEKWKNVGDKTVITEGGGLAGLMAQLAVVMSAVNQNRGE